VGGRVTLLALRHLEFDLLALVKGLVAVRLDRGEVDEDVLATRVGGNEAVALLRVEPLDGTGRHTGSPFELEGSRYNRPLRVLCGRQVSERAPSGRACPAEPRVSSTIRRA